VVAVVALQVLLGLLLQEIAFDWYFLNTTYLFYFNAIILAQVDEADTAVKIPGINPDADTNDNTEPSTVLATNVPTRPTYNPPATNPNEPVSEKNIEPVVGVTAAPPENCPFSA
jgi:hypothetical protein